MATVPIILGQTAKLSLVLADGNTGKYPRVEVYQPVNPIPLAVLNLLHTNSGMYEVSYTPGALGTYQAVYIVYDDPGHTVVNPRYSRELDQLLVRPDTEQQILNTVVQIKDLVEFLINHQENIFIDNTVYDDCCQILSSRVRLFASKLYCEAATDGGSETTGLVATYQIVADYEGPAKMKTYRKVKLP